MIKYPACVLIKLEFFMAVQLTLEQCQTCIQRCCAVVPRELKHPQQPLVKVTLHGALMLQAHCWLPAALRACLEKAARNAACISVWGIDSAF